MIKMVRNILRNRFNNEVQRVAFVAGELRRLSPSQKLLDAGCGSQQYRKFCSHLVYKAQDFGQYKSDEIEGFTDGLGGSDGYQYGKLDYIGDIWNVEEKDSFFDAILCTEVFEHIPFPNETVTEFSRLLKKDGTLILTVPSNCLRHMDPYYFYSGFSNRYIERMLSDNGFSITRIEPVGDYYSWMASEVARSMSNNFILSWICLFPSLLWYMTKRKTAASINTLCMGYNVVAKKN
jgi:SAM-dependent methyltransferase